METVVRPPSQDVPELRLLTNWGNEGDTARSREAGVASIIVHVLVLTGLALMPKIPVRLPHAAEQARIVTPLVAPPQEVTQTDPNKGKIAKELTTEALLPRPRIQVPPSPRSTTRPAARVPSIPSPAPPVTPAPAPKLPEPPSIEAGGPGNQPPRLGTAPPQIAQAPTPPQIESQEKPKIALENVGAPPPGPGRGGLAVPNPSVSEAIRNVVRGNSSGGLVVGDVGPPGLGGIGEGLNLPPSPGRQASNLELLSDPMGVDFRPYLIRILANVRRNWFAVMPESAKLGHRGRVAIQFSISRTGSVPKLVIVSPSGMEALDRAAVAGVSASNPFPPLPAEFKGDQIRLQFNFLYNIPRN